MKPPWYKNNEMWILIVIYTLCWPVLTSRLVGITIVPFNLLRVQSMFIDYTSVWFLTFAWSYVLGVTYHLLYVKNRYSDEYEYPKGFIPLLACATGITLIAGFFWILFFGVFL